MDEINLAPAELLESISGLLDSGSLSVADIGDGPIQRHPGFRMFGSMNPANDYGKKDLPDSLRNRFTELYVDEASSEKDIEMILSHYLPTLSNDGKNAKLRKALVSFYLKIRKEKRLRDISGKSATFSLRSLSRCLQSARDIFGATPDRTIRTKYFEFLISSKEVFFILCRENFKNS